MRNALVCWAPECGELVAQPATGRPRLYCSPAHKMRARRRNGDRPPTEPYPPLEPTGTDVPPPSRGVIAEPAPTRPVKVKTPRPAPLQQDATAATVGSGSEQKARKATGPGNGLDPGGLGSSDADVLGQPRTTRRGAGKAGNVTPPVVATTGKAPAPVPSSPVEVPPPPEPAPVRTPERAGAPPGSAGASDAYPIGDEAPAAQVTQLHLAITEDSTVPVEIKVHPMVAAYKADVARIGKAGTRQGLQVIEMAEKLVSSATSPAAAANLSKELQRLMDALEEASNDALVSQDPSLIIRDRTLVKLRAIQAAGAAEASA